MGRGLGADWEAVRRDYEAGEGTQVEIAARHGVLRSTLAMQKAKGGWVSARDVARQDKREAAIDDLLDTLTRRLKTHARTGAKIAAAMKALEAAPLNMTALEAWAEASAKAGRELSQTVSMTASVQRMTERRRGPLVRLSDNKTENALERPEYLAVERAILARLAGAGLIAPLGGADAAGQGGSGAVLGLAPPGAPDAA